MDLDAKPQPFLTHQNIKLLQRWSGAATCAACSKAGHGGHEGDVGVAPYVDHVVSGPWGTLELQLIVLQHRQQLHAVHPQLHQVRNLHISQLRITTSFRRAPSSAVCGCVVTGKPGWFIGFGSEVCGCAGCAGPQPWAELGCGLDTKCSISELHRSSASGLDMPVTRDQVQPSSWTPSC